VRKGKAPVLSTDEARVLLDAIDTDTLLGLRDLAVVGLTVYTFARVGAALRKLSRLLRARSPRLGAVPEQGGKLHSLPCTAISKSGSMRISTLPASRRKSAATRFGDDVSLDEVERIVI